MILKNNILSKFGLTLRVILIGAIALLGATQRALAEEGANLDSGSKYKKYVRRSVKAKIIPLAKFETTDDSVTINLFSSDSAVVTESLVAPLSDLYAAGSGFVLTETGFSISGHEIAFASIVKVTSNVERHPQNSLEKVVTVVFWTSVATTNKLASATASKTLSQEEFHLRAGEFLRGSLINFKGDVIIDGEVNHSVIVFGGDIKIGDSGVVRDHVVALGGQVTTSSASKVYGYVVPRIDGHKVRRPERPWTTESQRLSFVPEFSYNRVDGFTPLIGWKFIDNDSLLPELKLTYGIATTSEKQRFRFDAHQPLFGASRFSLNGAFYQELKSDDDDLIPEWQNTLYSLLATTDYKNYYEASGGSFGVRLDNYAIGELQQVSFSADMYIDELTAISSTRELWSLFGGDKKFYPNYQGIAQSLADSARAEFNDKRSAGIILSATIENKRMFKPSKTQWRGVVKVEKAMSDFLNSDFSFTRFSAEGEIERRLGRYSTLGVRSQFNASGGDLPLYRKFFLGGYSWLRGFDHKEYMGTKSWAVAVDYGINLKKAGMSFFKVWMFYDAGQISDHASFGDNQLLQSVGLGLSISDYIRLNFARRLDSSDPSFRIGIEL